MFSLGKGLKISNSQSDTATGQYILEDVFPLPIILKNLCLYQYTHNQIQNTVAAKNAQE